jgi:hypothetical protein
MLKNTSDLKMNTTSRRQQPKSYRVNKLDWLVFYRVAVVLTNKISKLADKVDQDFREKDNQGYWIWLNGTKGIHRY